MVLPRGETLPAVRRQKYDNEIITREELNLVYLEMVVFMGRSG